MGFDLATKIFKAFIRCPRPSDNLSNDFKNSAVFVALNMYFFEF